MTRCSGTGGPVEKSKTITIFSRKYDGESIVDMPRDVDEALDEDYNPDMKDIPFDASGFPKGFVKITIEWSPE